MNEYSDRRQVILLIFISISVIFLCRLFYIQVLDDSYKMSAENNVIRYVTQYPNRGTIYDRKGHILVYNQPAYDLMVIPNQLTEMDTTDFCELVDIDRQTFRDKISKAKKYSYRKPSTFQEQLSLVTYAAFQEKLYKFDGFFVQNRSVRSYPQKIAGNVLGYVSEVGSKKIERDAYYSAGDYIGASGVEQAYEEELRGEKGVQVFMVDVFNRVQGSFGEGKYDSLAVPGNDLHMTLDGTLQAYGELLMQNKKGSVVAIEPSTGEILAMISSPSYDPNLLVGRVRSKNYLRLQRDTLLPMFNRALMAQYPPGSIYKLIQALISLEDGVAFPSTMFTCNKSLVNCHNHIYPLDMFGSIQHSCNPYYYMLFKRILYQNKSPNKFKDAAIGFENWRKHIISFGLGSKLGIDIANEKSGNIPTTSLYDNIYGKLHWKFETIYSLAIGQGEILVVPLQMANLAAIIANKGFYYTPHLVRNTILPTRLQDRPAVQSKSALIEKHQSSVQPKHYELIRNAMEQVVQSGTARRARIDSIAVCGKTGTAENPHGDDHSVFIAFAPKDDPQIAISVIVENSGFGGTWAAPIASLMIEQYLTDSISRPEAELRLLEADFIHLETDSLQK